MDKMPTTRSLLKATVKDLQGELERLRAENLELREVLQAEIKGTPCPNGDPVDFHGYRHCAGCDARIRKALGVERTAQI